MKFNNNEFRIDTAEPVEVALDFQTLCALLAAHQAETPTARLARNGDLPVEQVDRANPAVSVLLGVPLQEAPGSGALGSFHAAAAARFNEGTR